MLTALQYQLLRRISPEDPPYMMNATAYAGRSKLSVLCGRVLDDITGATVVDFGCGDGLEAIELAQRGARRVYGIDANLGCVQIARWHADQAGVSHLVEFSREPPAVQVDMAVSLDSFEHFADPGAILRTLSDMLKPGGVLVASFGPPWYHPFGGHLFSVFPWAHLIFSEAALMRWREDRRTDRPATFAEAGLNGMTVKRFERLIAGTQFEIDALEIVPIRRLKRLHNRLTRELFTSVVRCRLRKPTHERWPEPVEPRRSSQCPASQ
jgi:SAM-dependent methyltransferase